MKPLGPAHCPNGEYNDKDPGNRKPHCFIATATFGRDSIDVRVLREFRDEILSKSKIGREAIQTYYQWSPKLALSISESEPLKALSRLALKPFVWLANYLLQNNRLQQQIETKKTNPNEPPQAAEP